VIFDNISYIGTTANYTVTFIFFRKALFKAEIPHGKTILPPVRIEKLLFIVTHKNALLFYFGVCVA